MFVACTNEEGLAMASDENVGVFMDGYTGLSEDGDGAVVTGFAHAHEGLWEVVERVGKGSFW
jgi:hypothetical protein